MASLELKFAYSIRHRRYNEKATNMEYSNLKQKPQFADVVAQRIWDAWWKAKGYSIEYIATLVDESLISEGVPLCLVAHNGEEFVGTVSVIVSDMVVRPNYSPWIAALWVDADFRNRGVGETLVETALQAIAQLGIDKAYLCALREKRDYYLRRNWTQIEEDVGEKFLTIMTKKPTLHEV